jgi:hypothetical protein
MPKTAAKKPAVPEPKTGKVKPAGIVLKAKRSRPLVAVKPQAIVKRMTAKGRPSLTQVILETL